MIKSRPQQRYGDKVQRGELLCAVGAATFVATGCWIGFVIAVNGVFAHGVPQRFRCSRWIVAYDTACNVCFTALGLATTTWQPWSWITVLVIVHAFTVVNLLSEHMPFASRLLHLVLIQAPAFVAWRVWCECCDPFVSSYMT